MQASCVANGLSYCAADAYASSRGAFLAVLASMWRALTHQLQNQFVSGSISLACASTAMSVMWRLAHHLRRLAEDKIFSTYDIPHGTPQYYAALRWLHARPAVRRASRRLVVPSDAACDAADANASSSSSSSSSSPHDPDDPLESGLRTIPVLLRAQQICVRVGAALVWVGHGGGGAGGGGAGGAGGAGGGGARHSWYGQFLHDFRGGGGGGGVGALDHSSAAFGWDAGPDGGASSPAGVGGGVRLRVLGGVGGGGERALRAILAAGHELGRGTARRYTQVYLPSTAVSARGGGGASRAEWIDAGRRPSRPISSVILKRSDATDALLDARAFLRLERWYAERGIPYRRGYLLHGPPGGGKTSLVRAIAGELRLPVYQASLGGRGLDDEAFHRLLRACARRAVVLLEDVDAASGAAVGARSGGGEEDGGGGGLTLPGLLSALDGVGAADGRLLFMTCRDASALEPALVRPGRIDVRIEFGPPDRAQAAALFRHFYGASDRAAATAAAAAASSSSCSSADRGDRSDASAAGGTASKPSPSPVAFGGAPPLFDARVVDALAEKFGAAAVASGETRGRRRRGGGGGDEKAAARPPPLSMAALQGHLMMYREDPEGAVDAIGGIEWGCD